MTDVLAPRTRVSPRRAQTREKLMTAAATVFAARGIIGASVEEICEVAGFTRGAFYSNFADKDALVLALIQADLTSQVTAAEQAIAAMKSASRELTPEARVSYALTKFQSAGGGTVGVLVQHELLLYAARRPELREPHSAFVEECLRRFTELIGDAMRASELEFTLPTEAAIELLTAAHTQMRLDSLFSGQLDPAILHQLLMAITRPAS